MRITIYGIRNCDTMKKARAWLEAHDVPHEFHDYKVAGIDRATLSKMDRGGGLGGAAESRRHHVPQAAGIREGRT